MTNGYDAWREVIIRRDNPYHYEIAQETRQEVIAALAENSTLEGGSEE